MFRPFVRGFGGSRVDFLILEEPLHVLPGSTAKKTSTGSLFGALNRRAGGLRERRDPPQRGRDEAQGAWGGLLSQKPNFQPFVHICFDFRSFFEPVRADPWRIDVDFSRRVWIRPQKKVRSNIQKIPKFPKSKKCRRAKWQVN